MGDAEMIHISRAMTAREMRDARIPHHIMMVKKSGGGLRTLATRIELYSVTAAEGFEHISSIWKS